MINTTNLFMAGLNVYDLDDVFLRFLQGHSDLTVYAWFHSIIVVRSLYGCSLLINPVLSFPLIFTRDA